MIPKLKIENKKLQIEGDFKFELSPTILTEDLTTVYKKITFNWCTDIPNQILMEFSEEEIIEIFAEKLKQDFKKLTK